MDDLLSALLSLALRDNLLAALLSFKTAVCALPDIWRLLESVTDDLFAALAAAGDRRLGPPIVWPLPETETGVQSEVSPPPERKAVSSVQSEVSPPPKRKAVSSVHPTSGRRWRRSQASTRRLAADGGGLRRPPDVWPPMEAVSGVQSEVSPPPIGINTGTHLTPGRRWRRSQAPT